MESCPPSCSTRSRPIFAVASPFTASCAPAARTAGTVGSWRSRASDADSAQAVLVARWPTGAWRIHQRQHLRPSPPRAEAQAARSAADRKPDRRAAIWIVAESECSFPRRHDGFNVHANVRVGANDRHGLEHCGCDARLTYSLAQGRGGRATAQAPERSTCSRREWSYVRHGRGAVEVVIAGR